MEEKICPMTGKPLRRNSLSVVVADVADTLNFLI